MRKSGLLHLRVSDELAGRYDITTRVPQREAWGLAAVVDPSGVLWRITQPDKTGVG